MPDGAANQGDIKTVTEREKKQAARAFAAAAKIDFSCRVCGTECDCAPDPPARAICPKCCEETEDHNYEYDPSVGRKTCVHCCQEQPEDWDD